MIRDPLAELWALSPRNRMSGSLNVPVKHPTSGNLVWLSVGQWLTLMYLRRRMKHGRGLTTLVAVGAATNAHPGTVTHRLDRLAQLGMIGRRSTVGRGHRTTFWPPSSSSGSRHRGDCARHSHTRHPAAASAGLNVAPSTPSGGLIRAYVSRGGLIRDAARGGSPPGPPGGGTIPPPGRRRPPRLIYESCPRDGGAVRLTAWRWRRTSSRLVALWDGSCSRCGAVVVAPLVIELAGDSWQLPPSIGAVLEGIPVRLTGDGRPPRRRSTPPAIPPGPRLERIRELAAEVIAGGDVDGEQAGILGARWLGWRPQRIPQPPVVAGDPAELEAIRAAAWSEARDWRSVRYSQPTSSAGEPDSLVRDSQPAAGDVDG